MAKIIRIDFQKPIEPDENGQTSLWQRFDPPKSVSKPNVFVHPSIDRLLTNAQADLRPTAFTLARALATFMQPDRDRHVFWACPSREQIMERAGVKSMTTFKRHFKAACDVLGIECRRRQRGSNIYTWRVGGESLMGHKMAHQDELTGSECGPSGGHKMAHHGGPDNGPPSYKEQITVRARDAAAAGEAAAIAARIWSIPDARSIVEAAGMSQQAIAESLEKLPLPRKFPATWLAALEKLIEQNHPDSARAALIAFTPHSCHRPDPKRVDELNTLLAIAKPVKSKTDTAEDVG